MGFDNFNNCPRLKAFKFSEDNANYCSDESGVWFNKDMTSLIKAPGGLRGTYTVPESVRVITQQSFNTCEGLTGVINPEGVTGIQPVAFSNCTSLREVRLPSTLVNIRSGAFMYCTSIESIDLPEGLTRIYEQVFYGCTSLKDVRLPESLEYIMEGAFTNCTSLESVFIPEGVIVIGGEWGTCAFVGCSSLKTFSVSEDNSVYSADGSGVLYDKSGRNIIEFPGGLTGEYTVSNSASIRGGVSFDGSNISVLRFTGHAPRYVFGDETLTVFYPANDPTWIYEQRLCELNHSGQNITWIPDESMETSFIPGDVDYNGIITNQDLITVARYAVGLITEAQLNYPVVSLFGDYNGDGEINNVDIIMIARSIVGIN